MTQPSSRMLLLVDPQIDFITGSLPVPGAAHAMDALACRLRETDGIYAVKAVTVDWHPYDHSSFAAQGGMWPAHCVRHTTGAALWPALVDPLFATAGETIILPKGDTAKVEEYSVFKNAASAKALDDLMRERNIRAIDVCGIAGDVCVLATLKDGAARYGASLFHVLTDFSPSLDGGMALEKATQELCA